MLSEFDASWAWLDPNKEFSYSSCAILDFGYSIRVNYNIWNHFLITHYHTYTIFVDIGTGRINKSEPSAAMSHKHNSMVRSAVETMMVCTENTKLCQHTPPHQVSLRYQGCSQALVWSPLQDPCWVRIQAKLICGLHVVPQGYSDCSVRGWLWYSLPVSESEYYSLSLPMRALLPIRTAHQELAFGDDCESQKNLSAPRAFWVQPRQQVFRLFTLWRF